MKLYVLMISLTALISATIATPSTSDVRKPFTWDATNGFKVVDMPGSYFSDINDNGLIIGATETDNRALSSFIWDGSSARDIGTLSGYDRCSANAINNSGKIVGFCTTYSGALTSTYKSFTWDSVSGIRSTGSDKLLYDINNNGTACGGSYIWTSTTGFTKITPPAIYLGVGASAINDSNVTVGSAKGYDGGIYGIVRDPVYGITEVGSVIDQPRGYCRVSLLDVNSFGQAVGQDNLFPVFWDRNHGLQKIGMSTGYSSGLAARINDSGVVLGNLTRSSGGTTVGFLWDETNGTRILASDDYVKVLPLDINNSGTVVGYVWIKGLNSVPEPSSIAALFAGIASMGCFIKRKK